METFEVEKTDFRTMLINEFNEAFKPGDLPSDPKEFEDLAKQIVEECMKLNNLK